MSSQKATSQPVTFRCHPPEYARLTEAAERLGTTPGVLARTLVFMALDRGLDRPDGAAGPPPADDVRRLVRTAAAAIITALSPDMDEAAAERYCATVFDA